MVFAEDVTDDARALPVHTVPMDLLLVHRVENTAMDRFETVPYVGNRPPDDDAHRVVEVRASHLVFERDRLLLWRFGHVQVLPRVAPQSCDAGANLPRVYLPRTRFPSV